MNNKTGIRNRFLTRGSKLRLPTRGRALATLFFAVVLTVIAVGFGVFEYERQRQHDAAILALSSIAERKLRQMEAWRRDRLDDLYLLTANPAVAESMREITASDHPGALATLRDSFVPLVASERYDSVYVLDENGEIRFRLGDAPDFPPQVRIAAQAVLTTGAPQFLDAIQPGDDGVRFHLLTAIPGESEGATAGVLGVQLDPAFYLEPVIVSWPVAHSTGEVVLLRGEGDRVRFLSSSRAGRAGTVLPAWQANVGARALRSRGVLEGTDYRGAPVLAVAVPVPGTPWRLLLKIDQQEVFAPIRHLAIWIIGVILAIITVAALLIFMWWRSERARVEAEAAREREALARHFDYLAKYANDIILLADEHGRIVEANERAVEFYGYSRDELLHMRIKELRAPQDRPHFEQQWALIAKERARVYEVNHQTKSGRVVPIEASARLIDVDGKMFFQSIERDISERKIAEQKLQRTNRLYVALAQTNESIVRLQDRRALFHEICRIAVENGGFADAWIALHDPVSDTLTGVAHAGKHARLFARLRPSIGPQALETSGVSACAFRSGEICVSNDFQHDVRTQQWPDFAEAGGIKAAASIPIQEDEHVIGVFSVYAAERDYFDEQVLTLLTQMAVDISFALANFRREALRAQAEKETRESEHRYRQLVDNMSPGMVVYEPLQDADDFIVRDVNRAFEQLERVRRVEVIGARVRERMPNVLTTGEFEALQRVWLTGNPESLEVVYSLEGKKQWRDLYIYALPTRQLVTICDDITQRKAAEQSLRASEERLALVLQGVNDGWWDIDYETHDYYFSKRFAEMFGYAPDDMAHLAEAWVGLVHPEDRPEVEKALHEHIAGKTPQYVSEHRMLRKDGSVIWVQARGAVVRRSSDGTAQRLAGTHRDITERKEEENQLRLWATVFEDSQEGIFITDSEKRIVSANAALTQMLGYSVEEMMGRNPRMFSSGEQDRAFYQNMWASINETGHWQGEIWDRRKNGEIFPLYTSITATRDPRGAVQNYIAICTDISERKATEERIRYLAHHDVLTGLPNRALLEDRLEQSLAHAQRTETRVGVLFVDLDRFKNINDSLGHHMGDELLKMVAQRLRSCVRVDDTVSRQGGDEFILLATELGDASDAGQIAQKVLETIHQPFTLDGSEIQVTASVGIAIYPEDGADSDALIRNADAAMYYAKEQGRNNFQFFVRELNLRALRRISMESALRKAIDHGDFILHYQPQVNIWSGDLVGVEALLRWQWGDRLMAPGDFIPIAEETGLIIPIGDWVLQEACRQQGRWMQGGLPAVTMAVNISAAQFHRKDLLDAISAIVLHNCVEPTQLEVELTESMIMQDAETSMRILDGLKELGVTLAIDDFGTGYSSLSYLRRFRIDRLKVDQSFVRDLETDPADRAITEAIIALGKSLGLRIIAEGVERAGEIQLLRESRCDELQGFYFSPPLAADEFFYWWLQRSREGVQPPD
jgi:diguanylate cyclase (GGDEF)-like protein/PAS domain S-box-containing protein